MNQRRYEAPRAYLYEGASLQQAADAAGYTRDALTSLVRDLRAGRLTVFAPPGVPGRKSAAAAPFLVVVMRVSGSRRIMGDYLNGNAAKLLGWLTATLMAAAALVAGVMAIMRRRRLQQRFGPGIPSLAPVRGRNRGVAWSCCSRPR